MNMNTINIEIEKPTKEQLRDELLGAIFVNLRKPENDGTVTRECVMFPDLEEYLAYVVENQESYLLVRVQPMLLEALEIDVDVAWEKAVETTSGHIRINEICSEINLLSTDIYGGPIFPPEELEDNAFSPYVLTNEIRFAGAGAILYCRDLLKDVSKDTGTSRWIAYPASAHEWILEPDIGAGSLEDRASIMLGVDRETGQDNRLIDKVYYLTV